MAAYLWVETNIIQMQGVDRVSNQVLFSKLYEFEWSKSVTEKENEIIRLNRNLAANYVVNIC